MSDNEIKKAFEHCVSERPCVECVFKLKCLNQERLGEYVLDLINRQQAEIAELQHKNDELEIELKVMRGVANSYKREIERLHTKTEVLQEVKEQLEKDVFNEQMNCDSIAYEYELLKQEKSVVKSEAIKEFAERLKEQIYIKKDKGLYFEKIDNLVKEMTEVSEK